jgi:competence protein ComEC
MIDVGTGLAMLVQGADFSMLYDAGTNDAGEKPRRVLAYLAAVLGPSGDAACVDEGAEAPTGRVKIDHVVLSHPHLDHASALDEVLHCYDVGTFWDAGAINEAKFYAELLSLIGQLPTIAYRTAADVPAAKTVTVKQVTTTVPSWETFHEGDTVALGEGARFTILHANGKSQKDMNASSIVLAVALGGAKLLLVGDAESGERKDPSYPPGDIEEHLIDHHAAAIRSDILQVGHHGSLTSTRGAFLAAVAPALALVSAGPKRYGSVVLPDPEIIDTLRAANITILRTDERDQSCPLSGRIGGDKGPGGCDSWMVEIAP